MQGEASRRDRATLLAQDQFVFAGTTRQWICEAVVPEVRPEKLNDLLVGLDRHSAYLNIHTSNFPGREIRANLLLDNVFSSGFD